MNDLRSRRGDHPRAHLNRRENHVLGALAPPQPTDIVLNALVLLHILYLTVEQITGVNVAAAAVLALITRAVSTPSAEVVARVSPGDPVADAGPALEGVKDGTVVDVDVAAA